MTVSLTKKPLPGTERDPFYPDSDGKPLGETGFHVDVIFYLKMVLDQLFHDRQDVYVAADMFFYYEKGNPSANKSPDVMVIPGVGGHQRRSFRLWEEARGPSVIFEITSEDTWQADLGEKRDVYARLGVTEYFVFDPEEKYIDPVLQGFRLENGRYVPLTPAANGSLESQELRLRLIPQGSRLRLVDLETGQPLLSYVELAEQERMRAEQQRQLAEKEKQRAEKERKRAKMDTDRAKREKQRAEKERQRAEQEKQRADALAAELARLKASQNGQNPKD